MGIRRLLSYKELTPEAINVVDAFYGTEAWRTIYEDHPTSASRRQRSLRLRELYMQKQSIEDVFARLTAKST